MSRIPIPFLADDISAVARSLRDQLEHHDGIPGHVELLNMLARSTGHRNIQSLRAQQIGLHVPPTAPTEPVDFAKIQRIARYFDGQQRLVSWPSKPSYQSLCLWALWSKLPSAQDFTEEEVNRWIRSQHLFGDYPLLRRELCDQGHLKRTPDGREYRRVERQPPAEALALIRCLRPS